MDYGKNPYYKKALAYIAENDLTALECGKYFLDGENLILNIVDSQLKTPQQARLEVHDKYIDIQVPLSKAETYGVKPREEAEGPEGEFDTQKDILFYTDKNWQSVTAQPGQPVTFGPETAHAPLIGEGTIHKAIFKVVVSAK